MSPGSGQTVDFDESVQGDLVGGVEIATKMTSSGEKIKLWETERNQKCDTIPLFGIPYQSEKNQKNTKYQFNTGKFQTLPTPWRKACPVSSSAARNLEDVV